MQQTYDYAFLVFLEKDARFFSQLALRLRKEHGRQVLVICYSREAEIHCEAAGVDLYSMQKECGKFSPAEIESRIHYLEEKYDLPSLRHLCHHQLNAHTHPSEEGFIRITAAYFLALEALFAKVRIGHLIQEIGGWTGIRAGELVCQKYGCTHVYIEPSMLKGHVLLFANSFYPSVRKLYRYDELSPEEVAVCEAFIEKTTGSAAVIKPFKDLWQYRDVGLSFAFSLGNLKKVIRAIRRKYVTNKGFEIAETVWGLTMRHFLRPFRRIALKRYYTWMGEGDRFLYYPLHMPIDMQILVREPQYFNQYALIEYIARMLPQGMFLYVKEHPVCIGTYDFFQMRRLCRIANVKVIDPKVNSHEIMRKAEGIVTVNSKVGFEALFYGKPVITFGDSFYRGKGFTLDLHNPKELADAIRRMGSHTVDRKKLIAFIHSLFKTARKGELYQFTEENYREFSESIVGFTQARADEPVPAGAA